MMKQLLNWFRLRALESDLDRELKYHIARRVNDLILSGLPEPEARRQPAVELGRVTQVREEVRDVWLTRWLTTSASRQGPFSAVRRLLPRPCFRSRSGSRQLQPFT